MQPGKFSLMQSYSTCNSRCFDLHVPSALLLIPDTAAPGSSGAGSQHSSSGSHFIKK
jgi:hypothetical protein